MLRYRGRIIITHLFRSAVIVLKLIVEEYIIDVDFGPTDLSCKLRPATLKLKMLELYRQQRAITLRTPRGQLKQSTE